MDDSSLEFLTTAELADLLRVSDRALELWRKRRYGPRFIRLGPTRILYCRRDIEEWLETRREPRAA
jgi:hypothetical protein